jgi:hypothetical protein
VGWLQAKYGSIELASLALRRTRGGRLTITFPTKRDRAGEEHSIVRPLDERAHRELEAQILDALRDHGWVSE